MNLIKKIIKLLPPKKSCPLSRFNQKKYWLLLAILLIFTVIFYPKPDDSRKLPIQIKGVVVRVEVANTPTQKGRGLMYRQALSQDEGMLFVYDYEGNNTFWMKNTLIPLDIIWLNSKKEVVHIEHSTPPCKKSPCPTYSSPYKSQYVLELNGGWAIKNGLAQGDQISF